MAVSEITIGLLVGGLLFVLYLLYRSVTEVLSYICICPDMNDLIIHKLIQCKTKSVAHCVPGPCSSQAAKSGPFFFFFFVQRPQLASLVER